MDVTAVDTIEPLTLPSLPFELIKELPKRSAVYFVISNNEVVYIGSSCNLNRRWKEHHRYHDFKKLELVQISWLELCNSNLLQEIELTLIYKFKPRLNLISSNQAWVDRLEYCTNNLPQNKLDKKLFCRLAVLMAEKNPQLSQRQLALLHGT
jgi:predicted GIY-YIG superfamily endonuclease